MLIVCPSCATSYMIEPASLGAGGRMVRCARCRATWFADSENDGAVSADGTVAAAAFDGSLAAPLTAESELPASAIAEVSGESAGSSKPAPGAALAQAVARAELHGPNPIDDAPPLVPAIEHAALADAAETDPEADERETFAARRQRLRSRRKRARRSSQWTAILLLLLAANVTVIGAREEVVRYLPRTASLFAAVGLPVNLRQLKFAHVRLSPSGTDDGLIVQGTIVSIAAKPIKVPDLRFAARNATGQEIYAWTVAPSRAVLRPGERLAFRSELASPPTDAKDVLVRFVMDHEAADKPAASASTAKRNALTRTRTH